MSYHWQAGEGIAEGFRRILAEELNSAIDGLSDPEVRGIEATVHDVRKRCKKVRGLARLVRPGLPKATFAVLNHGARDAAACISPIRDAHALLRSFDDLVAGAEGDGSSSGVFAVRAELSRRAHQASLAVAEHDAEVAAALSGLTELLDVAAGADLADDPDVVIEGATLTYRRGRDAMADAGDGDDESLHEWRKREKDLWYAIRLLAPSAPAVLGPHAKVLHVLSEDLGDDHDLAVLTDLVTVDPEAFGGQAAADGAVEVAARTRTSLQRHAFGLGAQVYAERPRAFGRRLGTYWKAWQRAGHDLPAGATD